MEIKEAKEILNKHGFILEDTKNGTEEYIKNVAKAFAKKNKVSVETATGIMLNYMFKQLAKLQDQGCPAEVAADEPNIVSEFKEKNGK